MEKRMQVASVQWFIGNKMHLKFSDRIQYNGNQRLLDAIEPTFLTRMKSKTHLDGSEESICLSDCETHSRVTDIWCLPSMWNSLARLGSDCLNKSPHFLSAWSIIVPTVCTNWFLCFPFLLWLRRLGLETGYTAEEAELVTGHSHDMLYDICMSCVTFCHDTLWRVIWW